MIEIEEDSKRWNFPPATIKKVQQRAAFICSNPECRLMTVGPSLKDDDQVQYAGKVAHILPASKGGPREIPGTTPNQRQNMKNAIFLCSNCADIIDKNNGIDHPIKLLKSWKKEHIIWVSEHLNKQLVSKGTNVIISNNKGTAVGIQNNYYQPSAPEPDKKIIHDSDLFDRIKSRIGEDKILQLLNRLLERTKMLASEQDFLIDVSLIFKKIENRYLLPEINNIVSILTEKMDALNAYINSKYDMFPYDQKRDDFTIDFMPHIFRRHELNVTTEEYNRGYEELKIFTDGINEVISVYQSYRSLIKQTLFK